MALRIGPAAGRVCICTHTTHTHTLYVTMCQPTTFKWPLQHYQQRLYCARVAQWRSTLCTLYTLLLRTMLYSTPLCVDRPRCKGCAYTCMCYMCIRIVCSRTSRTLQHPHSGNQLSRMVNQHLKKVSNGGILSLTEWSQGVIL